jgi:hypothetical protein
MKNEELEEIRKKFCLEIYGKEYITEDDLTLSAQEIEMLSIGYTYFEFVQNPYSGAIILLDPIAVAVYDYLKGCEMAEYWIGLNKARDWFRVNRYEAYYALID